MRKIISTIFILLGVAIIIYPKLSEKYQDYRQQKLLRDWEASLTIIDRGGANEEEVQNAEMYDNSITDNKLRIDLAQEKKTSDRQEYLKNNIDGILKIDKINLNSLILKGVTEENLKTAVATMEKSGEMGKEGNYAIAGHRSWTYGRNFNRLEEVEIGDVIEADDGENMYKYIVTEKIYVYPEETWVLDSKKDKKEITLITCHPMKNPTHRLIIKGEIAGAE